MEECNPALQDEANDNCEENRVEDIKIWVISNIDRSATLPASDPETLGKDSTSTKDLPEDPTTDISDRGNQERKVTRIARASTDATKGFV